ncbi:hypothetical protein D7V90_09740 [bacterium 1xD42-87]|jgi:glycerophosphoryl diester phosphodiesterase|nr:hypothetical protein D7V90_09740 [bacterium 1xD42-87]
MKIWAHRGCSQMYPENTITAFSKAQEIRGLSGIELDIQLTKDGEVVVIHDERVDRTTDGIGYVKDFTYLQLRKLAVKTGGSRAERIPTISEVLDVVQCKMEQGMLLNIELKNSEIRYDGMEERIFNLIVNRGLQDKIVYSSFYAKSLEKIRNLDSEAMVGVLDVKVSDCMYKKNGGCGADALHPFWRGIDLTKEQLKDQTVRAWLMGHLYPEKPTGTKLDLRKLESLGITDVFLNEPEAYLHERT